jgi:ATP-dependent DNA helicase RecG
MPEKGVAILARNGFLNHRSQVQVLPGTPRLRLGRVPLSLPASRWSDAAPARLVRHVESAGRSVVNCEAWTDPALRSRVRSMSIEGLLSRPEGKTLEFKRDLSSPQPVLRTLVAFANSAGGRLVIGVSDRRRDVVGVSRPLVAEERLASLIADSIEPRLLPEIEIVPWRRMHLVVVQVHPSALRPHHVRSDGSERGTYVRLGSTNRRADAALIAELSRRSTWVGFDEQPVPELDSEAIDFAAASECFAETRKLRRKDLTSLGILREHEGRSVPSVGGVILFGIERLDRHPDAWIQVGRFAGRDKTRIEDRAELRDYPALAIEQAIAFVERSTGVRAEISRLRRKDVRAVPPAALREALVNAVAHADYSQSGAPIRVAVFDDRVEIENPGILLPGLTIEEIRDGVSRLRNRVIGRVFMELGLVEQWGSGIQRMVAACTGAGLPEPEFAEMGFRFRVTLHTVPVAPVVADDVEIGMLEYLDAPDGCSTAEIAAHIGLSTRATQHRLAKLEARGLVVVIGTSPRDPRRRWFAVRSAPSG